MEFKLSIKRALVDILTIKDQVLEFHQGNEQYKTLLDFLRTNDFSDDDVPYPTLKEVEKSTGLSSGQLRKQIENIYLSLFTEFEKPLIKIRKKEYWFNLEFLKRYAMFRFTGMDYIPKVGEHISLPFVRAKIGYDYFYVRKIDHHISNDTHVVDIFLKGGFYNQYYEFRLAEAMAKGQVGYGVESSYSEREIKEMLGLRG